MKNTFMFSSKIIKFAIITLVLICLFSTSVFASKDLSFNGYNYDAYSQSTPAPEGYEPILRIRGETLPCGAFNTPGDICYAKDGNIYIADTGNTAARSLIRILP